jgi:type III secretory pathway component EscU
MNKDRRKAIRKEISNLKVAVTVKNDSVVVKKLTEIYNNVEFIYDQEEYYMDNMPENMQNGSKYEKAEDACNNLGEAMDYIYIARDCVNDKSQLITYVNKAIEYLLSATV